MHFDLRTIYFTGTSVFAICTIVIVLIGYQSRNRIAGIGFLAIDFAMQTAAILLIMFRSAIPDWMSISLANILVMVGSILGLMGLERFVGKITSQTYNYCLLAVYAFAFIYFGCVPTDVSLRTIVFLAGTLLVWFQCAWLMLIRVGPVMRTQTLWVGAVFVAYCLINVFRITTVIVEPSMGLDYFKSGILSMLAILTYQALFLFLTIALRCGVPAEIVPNLFDPYFTTRQSDTGTGIGLYLSRGIVEGSLEGRIHLVQGRLQGATFRIELPLKEETR